MSLLDVRRQFIQFTGRYDLITDEETYRNNGADFFIQSGQSWLDKIAQIYKSESRHYSSVAIGEWYKLISNCRAVHEVWVSTAESRKELKRYSYREFRTAYPKTPTLADAGTIHAYAPGILRASPETTGIITVDKFGPLEFTEVGNYWPLTGILFMAPPNEPVTLEVLGNFSQPKLTLDTDKNYWTEEQPFILTLAACRAVEISYRNTTGVLDWEGAVRNELQGLEFDLVDQESHGITQIRN